MYIKPSHSIQHPQKCIVGSTYASLLRPCQALHSVNMDASGDACGVLLSQEHDGQELPVAFLSHTFIDTQHGNREPQKRKPMAFIMQ